VQKFDAEGRFLRKWGSEGGGDGQFANPLGIAVDGAGNVYVTDFGNNPVQVFDAEGRFLRKWGSRGDGDGQFNLPFGIAVDGAGNVYVADTENDRVQKFSGDGRFLLKWGAVGLGSEDGQFRNPLGVAVDEAGNVYVADAGNDRVQVFDPGGRFLRKWGSEGTGEGQFKTPVGVALDGSGNVYVVDQKNKRVQAFDADGRFLLKWGSEGSGDGQFRISDGIAVDGAGNVYVTEQGNHRVQVFGPVRPAAAGPVPTPAPTPTPSPGPTPTPTWLPTGSLAEERSSHTATLLADGTALIVGGGLGGLYQYKTLAELYDPGTGSFTRTGDAVCAHGPRATATRLLDGQVLVAGGVGAPRCAEIYDPATGSFTQTADLYSDHWNHTATLLLDGRVLVAGGDRDLSGQTQEVAELYDPTTGTFSLAAGLLNTARTEHAAALLPNGQVLIVGGVASPTEERGGGRVCLKSAELYDPNAGTFRAAGDMNFWACYPEAIVLNNGKVLIIDGSQADLYDPDTGSFLAVGLMRERRRNYTATLLADGRVLIAGGQDPGVSVGSGINSAEIYDPASGTFKPVASMAVGRSSHTATLLPNGMVLVVGGFAGRGGIKWVYLSSAELAASPSPTPTPAATPAPGLSAFATVAPVVDGVLSPGEWDTAARLEFSVFPPPGEGGGMAPAVLLVMNDRVNLYLGLQVMRSSLGSSNVGFEFDNDHDGKAENGDDSLELGSPAGALRDAFRSNEPPCSAGSPPASCFFLDTEAGGTNDGRGAATNNGVFSFYEISRPLDSDDDLHDFSLLTGDAVGFYLHAVFCADICSATTIVPGIQVYQEITIAPPP